MPRTRLMAVSLALAAVVAGFGALPAYGLTKGLRYCEPPVGPGAYVAATPNVRCDIAVSVVDRIHKPGCWHETQCGIRGFQCISYYNRSFSRPFSYSHHGVCVASHKRRIEFDLG
jgi:hypothetical protein